MPMHTTTLQRFFDKVEVTETCWLWQGGLNFGYGRFHLFGKTYRAHRWLYEELVGPVPAGLALDHLCRVHNCVNVFGHLEPVTDRENTLRGNSFTAVHAAKTYCMRGHPFDLFNTRWDAKGRLCRICATERMRTWRLAHPGYYSLAMRRRRSGSAMR